MKKIIISGANFINKGAEAMMYITLEECIIRFPTAKYIIQLQSGFYVIRSLEELKKLSKKVLLTPKKNKFKKLKEIIKNYKRSNLLIDVSGFSLSSQIGVKESIKYLLKIYLCKLFKTKVVLLPQSFGPFDYPRPLKFILKKIIKRVFKYPEAIFVREKKSNEYLRLIGVKNAILSTDLVLQNNTLINKIEINEDINNISEGKKVALVVNKRLYEQCGVEKVNKQYVYIINKLKEYGNKIYLLCHASDDYEICKDIKKHFPNDDNIVVLENILSCFEFQIFSRNFNYIIAARYHSIVHAFKENIPCIALGWSIKYEELLMNLNQEKYLINVNSTDAREIDYILKEMENDYLKERKIICNKIKEIQKNNVFEKVTKIFKE